MEISTRAGPAHIELDRPVTATFLFLLTHGAGGGVDSKVRREFDRERFGIGEREIGEEGDAVAELQRFLAGFREIFAWMDGANFDAVFGETAVDAAGLMVAGVDDDAVELPELGGSGEAFPARAAGERGNPGFDGDIGRNAGKLMAKKIAEDGARAMRGNDVEAGGEAGAAVVIEAELGNCRGGEFIVERAFGEVTRGERHGDAGVAGVSDVFFDALRE